MVRPWYSLGIALLALSLSVLYAQQSPSTQSFQITGGPTVTGILVMVFLVLTILIMGFAYMFAVAFSIDKAKPHIKSEMIEVFASVLMLLFLWGIIGSFHVAAQEIGKYVAKTAYGLSDPNTQKLVFNVDSGTAFDNKPIFGSGLLDSIGAGLITGYLGNPGYGATVALGYTVSGQARVLSGPEFSRDVSGYLTMEIEPKNYRSFAEGILRKNIFCSYVMWSYAKRSLVPLTIARSASFESGGFDPGTGAALQIPIDVFKKFNNPTMMIATFDYMLIHLLRLAGVLADFLIPIGLILRSFNMFRPAGGFILSVAIVLYIFFPIGVVVFMGNSKSFASKCKLTETPMFSVDPCKMLDTSLHAQASKYLKDNFDKINNTMFRALDLVSAMWMETITSFLALNVALFSLMRALSGILGSDIAEIGRGLVKFV